MGPSRPGTRRYARGWRRASASAGCAVTPVASCAATRSFSKAYELFGHSDLPLVDVGCGVGLLGFYLRERNFCPLIHGLDRDRRKIGRATAIARVSYRDLKFVVQDVCEPIMASGNIVLFDLLHYLSPNEQRRLLERLAAQVAPGGMLVIRDCPRDRNVRFWFTQLAERFAQTITWNLQTPLHFPTREELCTAIPERSFSRTIEPLWGRTPFNNHLIIFRRHTDATAPAPGARSDNLPA